MTNQGIHHMLEVDLASQKCHVQPLEEKILREYIGGLGLGMKILYNEVGPDVDPLSSENILLIAPGPLSGTDAPTSSRTQVVTKSPLTGIIGIGNFGGPWGLNSDGLVLKPFCSEITLKAIAVRGTKKVSITFEKKNEYSVFIF